MKGKKYAVLAALGVVAAPFMTGGANATPKTVHLTFPVSVDVTTSVSSSSYCDNTGPHITFSSLLLVGDKWVQVDFRNNTQGTHVTDTYGHASLGLSQDGTNGNASVAKQPSAGGAGGNPFIYFEQDVSGQTYYLGRCVQDFGSGYDNPNARFSASGAVNGFVDLTAQSISCTNKGSTLTLGGTSGRDAVQGHLILTNSYWGNSMPTPQHIADTDIVASLGLTLVGAAGNSIPKSPAMGGAGGNPLIYAATGDYNNNSFTPDVGTSLPGTLLGRCNQLS